MTNKEDILTEYLSGASLGYLAKFYGVSRQRVHQIVQRAGIHRDPVHDLRRKEAFDFFDRNQDRILVYRGQRSSWSDIHNFLVEMDYEVPDKKMFSAWRKYHGINPPSGLGPQVYCGKCGQLKPRSEYWLHHRGPGGLTSTCKQCHNSYIKAHMADQVRRNRDMRKRKREAKIGK